MTKAELVRQKWLSNPDSKKKPTTEYTPSVQNVMERYGLNSHKEQQQTKSGTSSGSSSGSSGSASSTSRSAPIYQTGPTVPQTNLAEPYRKPKSPLIQKGPSVPQNDFMGSGAYEQYHSAENTRQTAQKPNLGSSPVRVSNAKQTLRENQKPGMGPVTQYTDVARPKTYHLSKTTPYDEYVKPIESGTLNYSGAVTHLENSRQEIDTMNSVVERMEYIQSRQMQLAVGGLDNSEFKQEYDQLDREINILKSRYGELNELRDWCQNSQLLLNKLEYVLDGYQMSAVANPLSELYDPDFEEKSKKISTKNAYFSKEYFQSGMSRYGDIQYEMINGNEDAMAMAASDLRFANAQNKYRKNFYSYMTDEEVDLYNYHYNTGGQEAAKNYLASIQETLNSRRAEEIYQRVQGKTFLEIPYGAIAGVDQFYSSIENLSSSDDTYIPLSATQMAGQAMRQDLEDDSFIRWYNFKDEEWEDRILGQSSGQIFYDLNNLAGTAAPMVAATVGSEFVVPGSGIYMMAGTTALTTAGTKYQEYLNQGYPPSEARKYAYAMGAAMGAVDLLSGSVTKGLLQNNIGTVIEGPIKRVYEYLTKAGVSDAAAETAMESSITYVMESLFGTGTHQEIKIDEDTIYSLLMDCVSEKMVDAVQMNGKQSLTGWNMAEGSSSYMPFPEWNVDAGADVDPVNRLPASDSHNTNLLPEGQADPVKTPESGDSSGNPSQDLSGGPDSYEKPDSADIKRAAMVQSRKYLEDLKQQEAELLAHPPEGDRASWQQYAHQLEDIQSRIAKVENGIREAEKKEKTRKKKTSNSPITPEQKAQISSLQTSLGEVAKLWRELDKLPQNDPRRAELEQEIAQKEWAVHNFGDPETNALLQEQFNQIKNERNYFSYTRSLDNGGENGTIKETYVQENKGDLSGGNDTQVVLPPKDHRNKTPGHWETILLEVQNMKDSGQYKTIYVHHQIGMVVDDIPLELKKRRPDIIAIREDGTIDLVEVASKTDRENKLHERIDKIWEALGDQQGERGVLKIPDLFREGMSLHGS